MIDRNFTIFANCQNEGIVWFKTCGLWQDNGYIPKSRRNNIFDWENDGISDHVRNCRKSRKRKSLY